MASNSRPLLNRLIGLETEYATLVRNESGQADDGPSRQMVYESICSAIGRHQPTARGRFDPSQRFLCSGGAITSEADASSAFAAAAMRGGLIEGATPEVRNPTELLAYQRAQDRLFATAASECGVGAEVRFLKNGADGADHFYGCQENYEADVASGVTLALYRLSILALLPLQLVTAALSGLLLCVAMASLVCTRVVAASLQGRLPSSESLSASPPRQGLMTVVFLLRLLRIPLVLALKVVIRCFAFRRQRRLLTAFLISRLPLTGDGYLDRRGKFWLSTKAVAIDAVVGLGSYRGERPIFVFRHWLEQLCGPSWFAPSSLLELLRRRQRLQIGLSDSNAADLAEYLKVAMTSLVLDMIESGGGKDLPRLKRPLQALRRIAGDWNLVVDVPTDRGPMSALRIQRLYFEACQRFVAQHPQRDDEEVGKTMRRWQESLDAAMAFRRDAGAVEPSLGRIDWLTKRWMLDQMSDRASWETRKKVDLRYHELSADSYFQRLIEVIPDVVLADESQVERAHRLPPNDSPARRRGYLVREFGGCDESLRVSWSRVVIGSGRDRRVVDLLSRP